MKKAAKEDAPVAVAASDAAAEWVAPGELKAWANNPRKNDHAVDGVAASITAFGFGAPILARKANREVIAGHTRLKAAAKLGLDRVPVRFLDVSAKDAHLLALADNKLGELASWDDPILAACLSDLKSQGADLALAGFTDRDLSQLLSDASESSGDEMPTSEPEKLQEKWGVRLGQIWTIPSKKAHGKAHRIICGDSTDAAVAAALMQDERAHMMWTDPPYGISYVGGSKKRDEIASDEITGDRLQAFLASSFAVADELMVRGAAFYVAHAPGLHQMPFLAAIADVGWSFSQELVWVKNRLALSLASYHPMHEVIAFGHRPGDGRRGRGGHGWYGDDAQTTVFHVDRPSVSELHPTMKPLELIVPMIRNSSPLEGVVYEPFSGSGSTMLAAEQCGRVARAIELDPKFVAVALERMSLEGCTPTHG